MAVLRTTTDVSDGNNSIGMGYTKLYKVINGLGSGWTITRITAELFWQFDAEVSAVGITSFTFGAAYPYNVAIQYGATGFTPVALTRGNYANADILYLDSSPATTDSVFVLPGTTDNIYAFGNHIHAEWSGELQLTATTDFYLQSYAGHQASPQLQFQQDGTVNVFYG
jgi:hypothetical protein